MIEKNIFVYKLFLLLNILDFSFFYIKTATPLETKSPPLKIEILSSPLFFKIWLDAQTNHPSPPQPHPPSLQQKGGSTLWSLSNIIVCKGVPAPLLRHPPPDPTCPPFQNICPLPSFLFHPLLKYFSWLDSWLRIRVNK